jgi:hypothetical protein
MATLLPKRISGRDMEILYRHACGMKNKDIAEDLGITDVTVSHTINSDWAKNELALLHARTLDKIANGSYSPLAYARAHANEAIAIQVMLMKSPNVKAQVRAKIADSILDRGGYRPATRIENLDLNDVFDKMSPEELDDYATSGALPERFSGTQISRYLGPTDSSIDAEFAAEPISGNEFVSGSVSVDSRKQSSVIELDLE